MEKLCKDIALTAAGTTRIEGISANGVRTIKLFIDKNSTASSFALKIEGGCYGVANEELECCADNEILSEPVRQITEKKNYEVDVDGYDYVDVVLTSVTSGNVNIRVKGVD